MSTPLVLGLPSTWEPVPASILAFARERAIAALDGDGGVQRLTTYFDRASNYSGTLFNELDPHAPADAVSAGDLLAVASLSIDVTAVQIRQLHLPGSVDPGVGQALAAVPADISLAEIGRHLDERTSSDTDALLSRMERLQETFRRTGTPRSDGSEANRWVFAAKLAARKRPALFPVRDRVVCEHLAPSGRMSTGGLGTFRTDIQVFAHLMADVGVTSELRRLSGAVAEARGVPPLRMLDVVLWMAGTHR